MSTPRPNPSVQPLSVPSNEEVAKRKVELFGSNALATSSNTHTELVIHKDSKEVVAQLDTMVQQGDYAPLAMFGQDVVNHLSAVANATTTRLIEIDRQAAAANVGQVSSKLVNLAHELDYENMQAPLEPLVKALHLTKVVDGMANIPLIGSMVRKLAKLSSQDKIGKVVDNIEGMIKQREPMLESLYGTKDNLHVSAYTVQDLMKELEAGRSVLGDRMQGASEVVAAVKERYDAATDPLEKKKLERALNVATRMQRGLESINVVSAKTQMQSHNSLALNEELRASIGEAIQVLPAVMNTGAAALMTTTANQRAAEELTLLREASAELLKATDVATVKTMEKAALIGQQGMLDTKQLQAGIQQLIVTSKRIRELEEKRISATQATTAELKGLTSTLEQEIEVSGAHSPQRKVKNVTPKDREAQKRDPKVVDI
jgi:uncharacterized protein YaaN involved in tellurite resistance